MTLKRESKSLYDEERETLPRPIKQDGRKARDLVPGWEHTMGKTDVDVSQIKWRFNAITVQPTEVFHNLTKVIVKLSL